MIHRNTRQQEQEYRDERKEAHKTFRQKRKYCLNKTWGKWKLLIIIMKERHFFQEVNSNGKMVQTTNITV